MSRLNLLFNRDSSFIVKRLFRSERESQLDRKSLSQRRQLSSVVGGLSLISPNGARLPRSADVIHAELVGVAGPGGGGIEISIGAGAADARIPASELMVDRLDARAADPPAVVRLEFGGRWNDQGVWLAERRVVVGVVPGQRLAAAGCPAGRIARRPMRVGGCCTSDGHEQCERTAQAEYVSSAESLSNCGGRSKAANKGALPLSTQLAGGTGVHSTARRWGLRTQ